MKTRKRLSVIGIIGVLILLLAFGLTGCGGKEEEKAEALEAAKKLEGVIVRVTAKAGSAGKLFGAVTAKEIAEALTEQHGITVEKNKIVLDEHIKTFGTFEVKCKLGSEVSGIIHVLVTEG